MVKLLEADTKKLEYLLNLSYGTLYIPYSQRPYEWKKEQVLRLFNDYYSIFTSSDNSSTHILNFITLRIDEDDDNKKQIYDGQQRTVTSLLIITALISKLKEMDNEALESANQLRNLYLYTSHWKDPQQLIKYSLIMKMLTSCSMNIFLKVVTCLMIIYSVIMTKLYSIIMNTLMN